jgi:hypothetical protein
MFKQGQAYDFHIRNLSSYYVDIIFEIYDAASASYGMIFIPNFMIISSGIEVTVRFLPQQFRITNGRDLCMNYPVSPFQSSHLEKFLQPGREGILDPCRATKQAVLLEKLVQQGHKVKNISQTVSLYVLSPCVLSLFF